MAGIDRVPPVDQTSIIGGRVGRTAAGGFGGVTPIQARGSAGIPADLYGLHQEEILRQPVPILGAGLIAHADYGIRTPQDLAGSRADLKQSFRAERGNNGLRNAISSNLQTLNHGEFAASPR